MLCIDKNSTVPIYRQLYDILKEHILTECKPDIRLPAIRNLAKDLCISINTVNRVYQQLLVEGYIYSVQGSGYYTGGITLAGGLYIPEDANLRPVKKETVEPCKVTYDFYYGNLDNRTFPWTKWRSCIKEALLKEEAAELLVYEEPQGNYKLRESIAEMLNQTRGVRTTPDHIVICAGVQDALRLLTVLLPPDKFKIAFEEPGYQTGRSIFVQNRYDITPIPVKARGFNMDTLEQSDCNLIYLTPSHQFPMGHVLPIGARYQILSYINEKDGYIIEDDYDSEFRYNAMPIPSLQSIDTHGRVIYIGTLSKGFSPTIRVAYMILPDALLEKFKTVCSSHKCPVASIIQSALYEFFNRGYYLPHIRKFVNQNEKKYNTIIRLFEEKALKGLYPITTEAGVHMILACDLPCSEEDLLKYLEAHDIKLYPTKQYWTTNSFHLMMLQMGFASMDLKTVTAGIEHLFKVFPTEKNILGSKTFLKMN